jgi:hypothetical protein
VFCRQTGCYQGVQFPIAKPYADMWAAEFMVASFIAEHVLGMPRSYLFFSCPIGNASPSLRVKRSNPAVRAQRWIALPAARNDEGAEP